ncbi:DUF4129 domain-containing protein [Isoptericola sp. NEAU-Y5]|uniref:DUF4129 domain-containing protein n=1 Tax=Isoptericola luteus TaxID=2879484 RepID=A0ABS7ZJH5_9MICO|nr:DUF4129 domain-containing protein [Isoptericola sp. NEAU-Y5]MCA5894642.1 DUF4129 domain-containing protein [Isoptericola sp. NEAU-Y5]
MTLTSGLPATALAAAGGLLPAAVPVDPDRATARRWLLEELSKPEYQEDPSLLMRFLEWFAGLFDDLPALDSGRVWLAVVLVVVVLVIVLIAWRVAGPIRLSRRARPSVAVLEDDSRTAAELRASADAAAARGDWSTAMLDRFRALVRSLEERVVLDERPGRTAQEAAAAAADRLPDVAAQLHRAAALFDDVCYGTLPARAEDDTTMRELDTRVAALRPQLPATVAAPGPGDPA